MLSHVVPGGSCGSFHTDSGGREDTAGGRSGLPSKTEPLSQGVATAGPSHSRTSPCPSPPSPLSCAVGSGGLGTKRCPPEAVPWGPAGHLSLVLSPRPQWNVELGGISGVTWSRAHSVWEPLTWECHTAPAGTPLEVGDLTSQGPII